MTMERKKVDKVGTVKYRKDGSKITVVNMDAGVDYRKGMAEALKKARKFGRVRNTGGSDTGA